MRVSKEDSLYRAAARVFRAKGYHAARIQDVADELGMQKGSLYYYISSKEDLLRGIVEEPLQAMIDGARDIRATGHAPAQKVAMVVELHLRQFQQYRDCFGIFLREDIDFLNRTSDTDIRDLTRAYDKVLDAILQEGVDAGAFRHDLDVRVVRKAIIGMCNGTFTWYRLDGAYPLPEIARMFAEFALGGIAAAPRTGSTQK